MVKLRTLERETDKGEGDQSNKRWRESQTLILVVLETLVAYRIQLVCLEPGTRILGKGDPRCSSRAAMLLTCDCLSVLVKMWSQTSFVAS